MALKANVDASAILEAIKICSRIAPPQSGNVVLGVKGNDLVLMSLAEADRCLLRLPGEFEGKDIFAIEAAVLQQAVRGRTTVRLEYNDDVLSVRAKNYETVLATTEVIEEKGTENDTLKFFEITAEQAQWLADAIRAVTLRPTVILSAYMPVAIRLTDKGAFVACYDDNHMAYARSREVSGRIDLNIPSVIAQMVMDIFCVSDFEVCATEQTLYIRNDVVQAEIGLPVAESHTDAQELMGMIKAASEMAVTADVQFDSDALGAFLDNARAIVQQGSRAEVVLLAAKDGLKVKLETALGTSRALVPGSSNVNATCRLDYDYFVEFVSKGATTLKIVGDNFVIGSSEQSTLLVCMNG